jgi:hypothetical protein
MCPDGAHVLSSLGKYAKKEALATQTPSFWDFLLIKLLVHGCYRRHCHSHTTNTHGHECEDGNQEEASGDSDAYSWCSVNLRPLTLSSLLIPHSVCAVSITRVIATYSIAKEYIKHPDDVIYYTAPVFFWTNIELSLAIVCACLPTLRPIWFHFRPRQATTKNSTSGYGSSKFTGTKNHSSFGAKYGHSRKPYKEIDEVELTKYDHEQASSITTETGPQSATREQGIMKAITIHQTLE